MWDQSSRPERITDPPNLPTLGIVGAGRVGSALAGSLAARGYLIGAVYSRSTESAQRLADATHAHIVTELAEVPRYAALILLTVPDFAITPTAEGIAIADLTGCAVVHTSGVTAVDALESAHRRGAQIGGLHPMLPIAATANPFAVGAAFGIEAESESLRGWLAEIVAALDGIALWLPSNLDRARYHAASVLLSNYLVTLFAESLALLTEAGIEAEAARAALVRLSAATIDNIAQVGPVAALTGPIVRGDVATVRAHRTALHAVDPELAEVYRQLGRRTLRIAAARGLPADQLSGLDKVLRREETDHANNNP